MPNMLRVEYEGAIHHVMNRYDRRKTVPAKVNMTARLRGETMMRLGWIAERLRMGCRHTEANGLKAPGCECLQWPGLTRS